MATTRLFVELIVIGTAPLLVLALVVAAVLGAEVPVPWSALSGVQGLLLLPFAYVLGIVTDRAADAWFQRTREIIRGKHFPSEVEVRELRRGILQEAGKVADFMEYTRSRIRICRGWAFCGPGLLLAVLAFGLARGPSTPRGLALLAVALASALALTLACRWAWRGLLDADYQKLAEARDARPLSHFTAVIQRDGEYLVASCPEVPGANGQGRSKEEVLESLAQAVSLVLRTRREDALRGLPPEKTSHEVFVVR